MKNQILFIIKKILRPIVIIFFWVNRWIAHNKLKYDHNLGNPNLVSYPLIFLNKVILKIYKQFIYEFGNYSLSKYKLFFKDHYSVNGPGYGNFGNMTAEEKKEFYLNGKSRLECFFKKNKYLLEFKNGDSFLDIACGYGRDIRFLSNSFDKSKIDGFDINPLALEVIKSGNKNINVKVKVESFLNFDTLQNIKSHSYDWVLISHAFSLAFEDNFEKTFNLKSRLISEFIRISIKGLLILDHSYKEEFKVEIEQNTRCKIFHDYTKLFSLIKGGELYMMRSDESFAYLWKKI